MVHYYRAEIQRSNTWRTRLDTHQMMAVLHGEHGHLIVPVQPGAPRVCCVEFRRDSNAPWP